MIISTMWYSIQWEVFAVRKSELDSIIRMLAKENHSTPEYVRSQMQSALDEAFSNPDPRVRAAWNAFPTKGRKPSLEEFIEYIANMAGPQGS